MKKKVTKNRCEKRSKYTSVVNVYSSGSVQFLNTVMAMI